MTSPCGLRSTVSRNTQSACILLCCNVNADQMATHLQLRLYPGIDLMQNRSLHVAYPRACVHVLICASAHCNIEECTRDSRPSILPKSWATKGITTGS
jgi:hypothetical protein